MCFFLFEKTTIKFLIVWLLLAQCSPLNWNTIVLIIHYQLQKYVKKYDKIFVIYGSMLRYCCSFVPIEQFLAFWNYGMFSRLGDPIFCRWMIFLYKAQKYVLSSFTHYSHLTIFCLKVELIEKKIDIIKKYKEFKLQDWIYKSCMVLFTTFFRNIMLLNEIIWSKKKITIVLRK